MAASIAAGAIAAVGALLLATTIPARGQELPPPAYQFAALGARVPPVVLFAVALQESGAWLHGRLVPWPWTLDIAGTPSHYTNAASACDALQRAVRAVPATRIDVGLGQVNLGYQSSRYRQPCELLDPYRNLAVAATILHEQHGAGEDWLLAVGRYHHPAGGPLAASYRSRVHRHLVRVLGGDGLAATP
ncbi:lytic transglycosylase [Paraburkholderia aspalathi]|uniref:Transglycosylase SLT domain-containing protein n=1 Tax=Paraburkholderia aspalathi TaxID=1324617 RepID=A0A1I7AA49_9BURK|nr:lytic transglycosylase [Paraburkholderia aspalathi]SFT71788.1 hypothetical protein SAMN05192563_1003210 [Paraburkholderia aspalathi]